MKSGAMNIVLSEFLSKIDLVFDFYVEREFNVLVKGHGVFTGRFVLQDNADPERNMV